MLSDGLLISSIKEGCNSSWPIYDDPLGLMSWLQTAEVYFCFVDSSNDIACGVCQLEFDEQLYDAHCDLKILWKFDTYSSLLQLKGIEEYCTGILEYEIGERESKRNCTMRVIFNHRNR